MNQTFSRSLAIFCKVVDNYGDIGICWRLARQLWLEHNVAITLWIDDLQSFQRICPVVQLDTDIQQIAGVQVRLWRDQNRTFSTDDIDDIVIEFFAVDIPPGYVSAMARCTPRPVWLNLEGLSAEQWVEGCHMLPSSHPKLPLTKHFFFPGYTDKTGGLLHEAGLEDQRRTFQANHLAVTDFLSGLGVTPEETSSFKVSLFCYPHAPISALFNVWQRAKKAITCLVPEGVAAESIQAFLGTDARRGAVRTFGALTVRVLPFVTQPDYDKLLWSCDLNFVRGEDSWVRAQWAGRPFVWHIYPQDENLHHQKLRAFLQRYSPGFDSFNEFTLCWNHADVIEDDGLTGWNFRWSSFLADMTDLAKHAEIWQEHLVANGDLATNLINFAASLQAEAAKKSV